MVDIELSVTDRRVPKQIVDLLALRGPTDREALAQALGIGRSTLSRAVGGLLDARMAVEIDQPATGRGRRRTVLAVDPRRGAAVGFEFGLRHVRGALVDAAHNVVTTDEAPLPIDCSEAAAMPMVRSMLSSFERRAAGPVVGIGLAIPGPFDRLDGTLTRSSILPKWAGHRVGEEFAELPGCPVWV